MDRLKIIGFEVLPTVTIVKAVSLEDGKDWLLSSLMFPSGKCWIGDVYNFDGHDLVLSECNHSPDQIIKST